MIMNDHGGHARRGSKSQSQSRKRAVPRGIGNPARKGLVAGGPRIRQNVDSKTHRSEARRGCNNCRSPCARDRQSGAEKPCCRYLREALPRIKRLPVGPSSAPDCPSRAQGLRQLLQPLRASDRCFLETHVFCARGSMACQHARHVALGAKTSTT